MRCAGRRAGAAVGEHRRRRSGAGSIACPTRHGACCSLLAAGDARRSGGARARRARPRPGRRRSGRGRGGGPRRRSPAAAVEFTPPARARGGLRRGDRPGAARTRTPRWRPRCPSGTSTAGPGTWPRPRVGPDERRGRRPRAGRRPGPGAQRLRASPPTRSSGPRGSPSARTPAARLLCRRRRCRLARRATPSGRSALLDEARPHASDPPLLARVDQLRGHVRLRARPGRGRLPAAGARRPSESAEIDPELAVVMLAEAVQGGVLRRRHGGDGGRGRARRRSSPPATARPARAFFAAMAARRWRWWLTGDGEAGAPHARRAVAILQASDDLRDDPRLLAWAAFGPMYLREADAGRELIERAFEQARSAGGGRRAAVAPAAPRARPGDHRPLVGRRGELRRGDPPGRARPASAPSSPQRSPGWPGSRRARARRRPAAPRRRGSGAVRASSGSGTYGVWAMQALGDLELGLGQARRGGRATTRRRPTRCASREIADVDLSPAPELVDAYLRLAAPSEAAEAAAAYVAAAEAKGQPWALARAARCRGMLAEDGRWEARVRRRRSGCTSARSTSSRRARTRLAYGARLRRGGQRSAQPRAAAGGARDLRAARCPGLGRPGAGRAGGNRRDGAAARRRARSTTSHRRSSRSRGCWRAA